MIQQIAYELYKEDWKKEHGITREKEMTNIRDYYEVAYDGYLYEDYVFEYGYSGELYVCFDEFLDNEYQDEKYMCDLLDNEELIKIYKQDFIILRKNLVQKYKEENNE